MLALKSQHAGKAIWDRLVKEAKHTLSNKVWSGNTPTTLAQHMCMHCHAWITLTECAKHIPVDMLNDRARFTYLMDLLKTVVLPSLLSARMKLTNMSFLETRLPICSLFALLLLRLQRKQER
jgi:hypothetical protein